MQPSELVLCTFHDVYNLTLWELYEMILILQNGG